MNLNSTKQAIHDALTWEWKVKGDVGIVEWSKYLCRIQKSGTFDNNSKIQDSTEVGYILAAISKQKSPIPQWLHYAYGIENRDLDKHTLASHLFFKYFHGVKPSKITRYQTFCILIVEDYKMRLQTHGAKKMPIVTYGKELGIDPNNWIRDWKHKWGQGIDELIRLDAEGIGTVSRVVKSLRGDSEHSPSEILQSI